MDAAAAVGSTRRPRDFSEAVRAAASALAKADEWLAFADAHMRLNEMSESQLSACKRELQLKLTDEAVSAHEPDLVLPRLDYRERVTADAVETLVNGAHDYAIAFAHVNELLDTITSEIFGDAVRIDAMTINVTGRTRLHAHLLLTPDRYRHGMADVRGSIHLPIHADPNAPTAPGA